jgi:hypothetical protein
MRQRASSQQAVESVTIGAADSKQFDLPRLQSQDGKVVSDLSGKGEKVREGAPHPHYYRVQEDRGISQDGYRTTLRAGKVIADTAYDIKALKRQGVKLEDLGEQAPEDAPS